MKGEIQRFEHECKKKITNIKTGAVILERCNTEWRKNMGRNWGGAAMGRQR
jgi:hypothetical protein